MPVWTREHEPRPGAKAEGQGKGQDTARQRQARSKAQGHSHEARPRQGKAKKDTTRKERGDFKKRPAWHRSEGNLGRWLGDAHQARTAGKATGTPSTVKT